MKNELTFDEILQYYKGKLTGKKKEIVKKNINNNQAYQEMLAGLAKMDKESKEKPETIIKNAKNRFFNKFFSLCFLVFAFSISVLD